MRFNSLDDAARALLLSTCEILNTAGVSYVVAGGWIPVLRGGNAAFRHPGTRDVDILFSDEAAAIVNGAQSLLAAGFCASAKHEFQLLRPIDVGGRRFIFNVDLMHQGEFRTRNDMFADVFDLGIPDSYDPTGKRWLKSIIFTSSAIIFEQRLWSPLEVEGVNTNGACAVVPVPLMNEAALILSKVESVVQVKRPRDSFDIFFVITGPSSDAISAELTQLSSRFPPVASRIAKLKTWIEENSAVFDGNVMAFANVATPSTTVTAILGEILRA